MWNDNHTHNAYSDVKHINKHGDSVIASGFEGLVYSSNLSHGQMAF